MDGISGILAVLNLVLQADSYSEFGASIGAGIAMAVGSVGPAIAIGILVGKAMEALGRNPEARTAIQTNMILGVAFAEAIAIYALLTAIIIKFV